MTPRRTDDRGFTLVELLVVMVIVGTLMAISAFAFSSYRNTAELRGSSQELMSTMRSASEQAISEGRTYCVDLTNATPSTTNRSFALWQRACTVAGGGTQVGGTRKTQSSRISFSTAVTNPNAAPTCPAGQNCCATDHACIYFYPRGTALQATVTVSSSARSGTYTIHVERLTARVWI
jgi:type II secretion system protein H